MIHTESPENFVLIFEILPIDKEQKILAEALNRFEKPENER